MHILYHGGGGGGVETDFLRRGNIRQSRCIKLMPDPNTGAETPPSGDTGTAQLPPPQDPVIPTSSSFLIKGTIDILEVP
jgi:hypothetical protein